MTMFLRGLGLALSASLLASGCNPPTMGRQPGGETLLPTFQTVRDNGDVVQIDGRPVDGRLSPDGKWFYVKDYNRVRVIDAQTWKFKAEVTLPGGASLWGMEVAQGGRRLFVTNAANSLHEFRLGEDGSIGLLRSISLGEGNSFPCGLVVTSDSSKAWVALSLKNKVAEVDLVAGTVLREVDTGVAPYDVAIVGNRLAVTCMGGRRPLAGEPTAPSAKTETRIDHRGVAAAGSLVVLGIERGNVLREIETGRQPSDVLTLPGGRLVAVAETNEDTVALIDVATGQIVRRLNVRMNGTHPWGSMPTAMALSPDARTLYVANAGDNSLAMFELNGSQGKLLTHLPTHWYPAAVVATADQIMVVNNKGYGARLDRAPGTPRNSHDKAGTLLMLKKPDRSDYDLLSKLAAEQARLNRSMPTVRVGSKATPTPIPKELGDPSTFRHVIYVIKENRTYDQFFGNLPGGKGMPSLNIFTDVHIPNQRRLAQDFVLLDNYYCNGVLSADGHSWATEGNVTPYLNRAFGGFTRSYTFGDDPITYSLSGFVWDRILDAGLTFRNYGEMNYSGTTLSGAEVWRAYKRGENLTFTHNIGVARLKQFSCPDYPGWNMSIPDQLRMDRFLAEFRNFEQNNDLPNFMTIYLPQDHAGGAVTPRAHMADNDLAVGRLVEAVSRSRFWPNTVIFINEDDPQAGTDHVDGHRSICLVVSPYSRNKGVVSQFYNQVSVLRTIHQIFGIEPINQQYLAANVMRECFGDEADLTPYTAITPQQPLDEGIPPLVTAEAKALGARIAQIDLSEREVQTPAEMDALNRWVWHLTVGWDKRYPAEWAGAHGRGLAERGLKFGRLGLEEEEEEEELED